MMNALIKKRLILLAGLIALLGSIVVLRPTPPSLVDVLARGELVVASRPAAVAWYQDQHGDTGFEYTLAREFADQLGVSLRIVAVDNLPELHQLVRTGQVDIAAAALAITPARAEQLAFTEPYLSNNDLIIYRTAEPGPKSLADLSDRRLAVLAGSSQEAAVQELISNGIRLQFQAIRAVNVEHLLNLVHEGHVDMAVVDRNGWQLHKSLFPELAESLTLAERQVAWALSAEGDGSLLEAANRFLGERRENGTVARLAERFYGQAGQMNLYSSRSFLSHIDSRLSQYAEAFREAGEATGFDWRLLAAMGYQESLWDQEAVSPTGVRGLMMLTQRTAREMNVADRTDPIASIHAGAAYLRKLHDRIPERIAEPDRLWMAVAAYNVGMGHVEDARILTQKQGGNPDVWEDVRQRLPLLRKPEFHRDTRYGYARGGMQSVIYVRHIQQYYDLLLWAHDSTRHGPNLVAMAGLTPTG